MATIFVTTGFKHGKFCAEQGNTYELPDDVVGYFKMCGWARDAQDGDPSVAAVITYDDLSPHAPEGVEVVVQPDNGVLGVASEGEG